MRMYNKASREKLDYEFLSEGCKKRLVLATSSQSKAFTKQKSDNIGSHASGTYCRIYCSERSESWDKVSGIQILLQNNP